MRRAQSCTSAQARAQLSSHARFVAGASFMKNMPQTHSGMFSARRRPHERDWERASNLLIERPVKCVTALEVSSNRNVR